jgi:sodium-dependent dicarboxylate transporter 2/3/5
VTRRAAGLAVGPAAAAAVLALPLEGVGAEGRTLLAVFVWTVVYWVTEALPIPVTALLSSLLAILLGIAPARSVLAPYADPVIFLFVGSFMLAEATRATGLDRRLALTVLGVEAATRTPARLLGAVGLITCGLSLWMSNTATTAIMLPIGVGLLRALGEVGEPARSPFPVGLLLMLTWASSVAVGIPVGSPPNLIAIGMVRRLTEHRLTFFEWTAVTLPMTAVMLAVCWLILARRYDPGRALAAGTRGFVAAERAALGPWTPGERNTLAVFLLACGLWMLPGAVALVTSPEAALFRFLEARLPEPVVALLAAILLFVLPTDLRAGAFTLTWRQAARIDWGTILLFGGGLSLGHLMFETGLAEALGRGLVRLVGSESLWTLTAAAIVLGVLLSEASSNTASASVALPVVIAVAQSAGVSPVPPAMGAALGASFGFVLPVSTPPNAIVYGSGLVPMREMIRSGLVLDVAGAVIIWVGLRLLCPLVGLA